MTQHLSRSVTRALALGLILSPALSSPLYGATPTLDQLLSVRSAAKPKVSPDGLLVCYEVSETDWKENAYVSHLWIAEARTGRSFQLTHGKKTSDNAQWSPDGRWIAFLTDRESGAIAPLEDESEAREKKEEKEEKKSDRKADRKDDAKPDARQIWLISPSGGEAWQLTRHGAGIDAFRWSPDGTRIALVAPVPETKAAKDRKEKYSDYEVFEQDFDQNQLWVVDVGAAGKTGRPADARQIVKDRKLNVGEPSWSPDGTRIAFSGSANPLLSFAGTSDIYIVDLAQDDVVTKVVALEGPDRNPRFSPDGTGLAFETSFAQPYFYYANSHIASVRVADVLKKPATKPEDVVDLTPKFDEQPSLLDWSKAGVSFRAQQKTTSHLFHLDPATKVIERITPDGFFLGDAGLSPDGSTVAFTASDASSVSEVFVSPAAKGGFVPKKLTDMNAQFAGFALGTVEMVSWKSKDGATIEGVLHKPADYDLSKKYPLLVVIHGGPTGVSRPVLAPANRYYPIEQFLAKGALVLEPNYRGSAGYGYQFRSLNVRNLGIGDMWDVLSGIDALIAKGIVDPARLGSMGWSQGGYISAFLTTNTDRFKAISVGAGISDWATYYVNTDITPFTRQYLHATPWDDPQIYASTSPITNIRKAKTPTLIQHGDKDKRVPPPNAFELYRGLVDVGVPARLILYAGFGHPITKPKSNRAVLQHNLDWFGHYVFGEPIPSSSPLHGSGEEPAAD
jgi:dipeptidyl aminopeptidase/acylaminoacyl peptidase